MKRLLLSAMCIIALIAGTTVATAKDPYSDKYSNLSQISLTGDVVASDASNIYLDYGDGIITVEVDDYDIFDEANQIQAGEKVTIEGLIDDSAFENRTIEASSVYVHDRNTYYFANPADEEGDTVTYTLYSYSYPVTIPDGTYASFTGTVENVNGREFVLNTGGVKINIDTDLMHYNPMDDVGFQQIDVGDRVIVSGKVDRDLFEKDELQAVVINTLSDSE
jgi:uncharacterized protein YdeI (BOF family)